MGIVLKISFGDDLRRFPVREGLTYAQLHKEVADMFELQKFRLKYIDEDQELITISSDRELNDAITYLREQDPRKIVRFYVRTPEDSGISASMLQSSYFGGNSTTFNDFKYSNVNPNQPPYSSIPPNSNPTYSQPPQYPNQSTGVVHQPNPTFEVPKQVVSENHLPSEYSHPKPSVPPSSSSSNVYNPPPQPSPASRPDGSFSCHFEGDKQIPDGTIVKPGSKFTKIWLVKNSGDKKWPPGTVLEWVLGDKMEMKTQIRVQEANPGEVVEIPLDITAPMKPGKYTSHFRFNLPNGKAFGHRVWVDIEVKE